MLGELFKSTITTSTIATFIAVLIFIIRKTLKNQIGVKYIYRLWIILLLYLLSPALSLFPVNPLLFFKKSLMDSSAITDAPFVIDNFLDQLSVNTDAISTQFSKNATLPYHIMPSIWLVIASIIIIFMFVTSLKLTRKIHKSTASAASNVIALFDSCKKKLNLEQSITLSITTAIKQPCLFGLYKGKILFPKDLDKSLTTDQIRYIFIHELIHYKRKDHWLNWLIIIVSALNWFNPIVLYALYSMTQDNEIICDSNSLTYLNNKERIQYGETILDLLTLIKQPKYRFNTIQLINKKKEIERRLKMIVQSDKKTKNHTLLGLTVLLLISSLALTSLFAKDSYLDELSTITTSKAKTVPQDNTTDTQQNKLQPATKTNDNLQQHTMAKTENQSLPEFINPLPEGLITSHYGYRSDDKTSLPNITVKSSDDIITAYSQKTFHTGIDIAYALGTGTVR